MANVSPTARPETVDALAEVMRHVQRLAVPGYPNLPALSIRQPWAYLICHHGKNIENRCWPTNFRGWFLIHAAKGCTRDEYEDAWDFADHCGVDIHRAPSLRDIFRGGIVGAAKLVDCVRKSSSPWFVGEWGFVLEDVKPLPFVPCKGALGFFKPQL